jgi:hypothetical protein
MTETPPDVPSGLPEEQHDEDSTPPDPAPGDAPATGEDAMPGIPTEGEPPAAG